MSIVNVESGYVPVNAASLYFETAGEGAGLVMIHAGVADSRQWNNEFDYYAARFRVLRYDMRGYGKSEPVAGEYSHLADLTALLDHLKFDAPLVVMGCSMGGGLAINLALTDPSRVKALVLVGSAPNGLDLDVPEPEEFAALENAFKAEDIELVAEIETHIWFDGIGRSPVTIDPTTRKLAYDMNRLALENEWKELGKRLPDMDSVAAERLDELKMPVLAVLGTYDIPYMQAAAEYMAEHIADFHQAEIEDAAHLPNMDRPDEFRQIVDAFLAEVDFAR